MSGKITTNKKMCIITTISKTMDWFVVESVKNLNGKGYDITLICDMDEDFIVRNKDYANLISIEMSRGIDIKNAIKSTLKMYKIFKQEKFDMVQYSTPNASLYASIAAFFANIPIRVYGQWGIRYVSLNGRSKIVFKILEKMTCMLSTDIRAVSKLNRMLAIKEKLCKSDKIKVIGEGGTIGVDLKKYDLNNKALYRMQIRKKLGISKNEFVFGYIGRVNADKGINELIGAFRELEIYNDNIKLLLIGMIDDTNPINDKSKDYINQSKNINVVGSVSPEDVCKYMSSLDCLVHPTYREGFGMVLQEAGAMQLPIITTNVLGASEVMEDGKSCLLVESKNTMDLKNKMEIVLNSKSLSLSLGIEARKRVEKYYDRKKMLKLQELDYKRLVEERKC